MHKLKTKMSNDVFESISQGGYGAYDEENQRIQEISDELHRRCQLHAAQLRDGNADGSRFVIEQRVAEEYAKSVGMWIPMDKVFDLGTPGPSGNENDTYVSEDMVYKVNNLLNCGSIFRLLEKVAYHNVLFPNTYYRIYGFTGFDGRSVMPILLQDLVKDATLATQIMIDTYMSALGFTKQNEVGRYSNGSYVVWDIVPRNVLIDADGDIYVVDAEIKKVVE